MTTAMPLGSRVTTAPATIDHIYRAGVAGARCWARNHRGHVRELPMVRWIGGPGMPALDRLADAYVLAQCSSRPTLDVGCGPGRLTASLQDRELPALGVDSCATAVELTRSRGGAAIHRDVFTPLPAEGCWQQVLLIDGNIGVGGAPTTVLKRVAKLLAPDGVIIAELDALATALVRETLRWETHGHVSQWFPWARVGAAALGEVAHAAGLLVSSIVNIHGRVIAVLAPDRRVGVRGEYG